MPSNLNRSSIDRWTTVAALLGMIGGLAVAWGIVTAERPGEAPKPESRALGAGDVARAENGRELVMVVLGSSRCGASEGSRLTASLLAVRDSLRRIAQRHHTPFASIGVALDDDPEAGVAWLRQVGGFDEVDAGQHMLNTALDEYVWRDPQAIGATPQVIVLLREVELEGRVRVRMRNNAVLVRMLGAQDITRFSAFHDLDSLMLKEVGTQRASR